jgi:sialate O-acetylesterase
MIAPVTPFSIAGAIWYQGESNTGTASTYKNLLTKMIVQWRDQWQIQFPFYLVQIAPYTYGNNKIGALLREAQTQTLALPGTGMVVTTDLAEDTLDIHPKNKKGVGIRLANLALNQTYGKQIAGAMSPTYQSHLIDKNRVVLSFDHVENGFMIKGKRATGFFIAGSDQIFYPAEIKISGNQILVWHKSVPKPESVRYAFSNTAVGNVFAKEGLPLSPFRTDQWDQ